MDFILRFNCNFVTAFHFHHKAARLYYAGLIFQYLIYVAFTGKQEHLNVFCDPFDQKETRSLEQIQMPERGPIWNDQKRLDPFKNYGMNSTTLKISICPLQAVAFNI